MKKNIRIKKVIELFTLVLIFISTSQIANAQTIQERMEMQRDKLFEKVDERKDKAEEKKEHRDLRTTNFLENKENRIQSFQNKFEKKKD